MRFRPALPVIGMLSAFLFLLAGTPATATEPTPTPSASPSLAPGDAVVVGQVRAVVPPPGFGVTANADFVDGTGQTLVVQTLTDGTVLVNPPFPAPPDPSPSPSPNRLDRPGDILADTSQCGDNFTSYDSLTHWSGTMNWYFKDGSKPPGLAGVAADLRAAVTNITQENNTCGRPDTMSATASYQGSTTKSANIATDAGCLAGDGTSVIDFGTMPSNILGVDCDYWDLFYQRYETDQRLNKCCGITWTTGETCPPSGSPYYVEGVDTHERGHTWNAYDFPSGHPNQTMGQANGQCPGADAKSTVGLGDMLSVEAMY